MTGKKISSDLLMVMGLVLFTDIIVFIPRFNESMVRYLFGLLFVLFLPGYSLLAALFPAKSDLEGIERLCLSFGLSIATVPLIGLALNYTPVGLTLPSILISLSVFTFLMCGLAYLRRSKLQQIEAFEVPFREVTLSFKSKILKKPESNMDKALTVFLVFSILLSVATFIYVIVTPKEGEHFTEFYILGPEGKANNYTTEYILGENSNITVGIVNHEYKLVNYTIEIRLENESLPFPAFQHIALNHNEGWEEPVTFTLPFVGEKMKLEFLLFTESNKTIPYRNLNLWIDVNSTKEVEGSLSKM